MLAHRSGEAATRGRRSGVANPRDRVLIIDGHPDGESDCAALNEAYKEGAEASGATVRTVALRALTFNPNLQHGYRKRTELEPDLLAAQEALRWSNHQVWIHPVWWGGLPALMKGFLDRAFLPGFFFKKVPGTAYRWEKLLTGRSARIIYTLDTPWFYWLLNGMPSYMALRWATLWYCGVSPIRGTGLGIVRLSTPERRAQWLERVRALGRRRE
jgi:putative NADPH-quinone reductase